MFSQNDKIEIKSLYLDRSKDATTKGIFYMQFSFL